MPQRKETDPRDLLKAWCNPARLKPLIQLLPLAVLGAYAAGLAWGAVADELAKDQPDLMNALLPNPLGLLAGFLFFGITGAWLERRAAGLAATRVALGMRARAAALGLVQGGGSQLLGDPEEAALSVIDQLAGQALSDRKEVAKYKEALSKYADKSLAQKLNLETSYASVGTKKVNMAVLFSDIRGFTKMSETLRTEEVVSILNDYFSFAAEAVHANGGRINKFIGDAVMAVFEDPPGHSTGNQACRNACMAGQALVMKYRAMGSTWRDRIATPFESDLGCGIHFGSLIFGNMGSPERMEYTAIGDTVNFASRLCSKAAGGQVRISEEVQRLAGAYFELSPEAPITVKGKAGEFKTWLVTGVKKVF
ncbi:MAG TPA: adenylate/guanylate cyclase domain-containing protein [Rhizomicrobium sp.]|nr:adenylate/guanylate cyclase domain-containing protein [Rhizomicrobium sp.]